MAIRPPQRNLSPDADPWARWVETQLTNMNRQQQIYGSGLAKLETVSNNALSIAAATQADAGDLFQELGNATATAGEAVFWSYDEPTDDVIPSNPQAVWFQRDPEDDSVIATWEWEPSGLDDEPGHWVKKVWGEGSIGDGAINWDTFTEDVQDYVDGIASNAETAKTDALEAKDQADSAFNVANTAQGIANQAVDNANDAQTTADNAATAAANAAGIAEGKADVLIQNTAPAAKYRNAQTLWIDTTNGANTPKRWVSGTTWQAVTDKTATDAATAAVAAQTTANQAKSTAEAAQIAANNAGDVAAQALTAADGKSRNWYGGTAPTRAQGLAVGDSWFNGSKWQTAITVPTSGNPTWRDMTPGAGYIAALNIGTGTAGNLEVGRLSAVSSTFDVSVVQTLVASDAFVTSLYSQRILVGTQSNLWPNGWDEYTDNRGMNPVFTYYNVESHLPPGMSNVFYASTSQKTANIFVNDIGVVVNPGEVFVVEWMMKANTASQKFYLEIRDQSGTQIPNSAFSVLSGPGRGTGAYILANVTPSTSWQTWKIAITIPENVTQLKGLRGYFNHTNGTTTGWTMFACRLQKQINSVLIEDGAVIASKVTASEELSAKMGQFLKVTTSMLEAGDAQINNAMIANIDAGKITSGTINAQRIAGVTLTGNLLQTVSTANRGVKIDSTNGIRAWDSSGNLTAQITPNNTDNRLVGTLYTSLPGQAGMILSKQEVTIDNETYQLPGIWFSPDGKFDNNHAKIYADNRYGFVIQGRMQELGAGNFVYSSPKSVGLAVLEGLRTSPSQTSQNIFGVMQSDGVHYAATIGHINASGTLGHVTSDRIVARTTLQALSPNTTTSGANAVFIISGSQAGQLYRSTSLRAAKVDIQDLSVDPYKILSVPIRDWLDRNQLDEYANSLDEKLRVKEGTLNPKDMKGYSNEYPQRIPGVVAEEVEDAGLSIFCTYGDGNKLNGVMYDRIPLALVPIVRDLVENDTKKNSHIHMLESRLESLEKRIERLENGNR